MKKSLNGQVYDSAKLTELCSRDRYNNGNYSGRTWIGKTASGKFAVVDESNGQDFNRREGIRAISQAQIAEEIDGWDLSDVETARLLAAHILTEA